MDIDAEEEIRERLCRLEDESAVRQVILSYGPAADAGLAAFAGHLWKEDGVYDWDAAGEPHRGAAAIDAMLQGGGHRGLVATGVAHFGGPPLIDLDGDRATGINYSLVMRSEGDRFFLWRVSAVRWDLERVSGRWRVRRRTNRLLDASGAGSGLFGAALRDLFDEVQS